MKVGQLLHRKDTAVATTASVSAVLESLPSNGIGAFVVSADGSAVGGIMTSSVRTCAPDASADELMSPKTEDRFRHLPATKDGVLVGIVPIGDIVNARLREVETENRTAHQLHQRPL